MGRHETENIKSTNMSKNVKELVLHTHFLVEKGFNGGAKQQDAAKGVDNDSRGRRVLILNVIDQKHFVAVVTRPRQTLDGQLLVLLMVGSQLSNLFTVTHLTDADGIEWIAQLRRDYTPTQLPILVFSLDPSLETVDRAFTAGAQDCLSTPFDPTVMEEKIENSLLPRRVLRRR